MPVRADDAEALRAVPPRDFVRARNALAAELERKGKAVEARRVRKLRRPSPVVWALNRAAARPRAVGELAQAVDRLRRAQLGQGELPSATERYRAALDALMRAAAEALEKAGMRVSADLERRLQSTLLVAVTDRRRRADLAGGALAEEGEAPGFEVLTRGPIPAEFLRGGPATPLRTARRAPSPPGEVERPGERSARVERRKQERKDQDAARRAARQAKTLDRAASRKERAADAADRKAEALRSALREQEQGAGRLRAAAREAREAHRAMVERSRTSKRLVDGGR